MIPRIPKTILILFAAALTWGAAARVCAFERQTVDDNPTLSLYWATRTIPVFPQFDGTTNTGPAGVEVAMLDAFAEWENAGGCTDIQLMSMGMPASLTTNLDGGDFDGLNRIVFRRTWPTAASPTALALTTVVYDRRTGVIQDADIDLNDERFFWTTAADTATLNDVQNTVTHELGHLLGFAHVPDPSATMFADSPEGEIDKRSLGSDDVDAVCTVYPRGAPTPGAVRRTGVSRGALTGVSSCTVSRIGAPTGAGALGPACLVVCLLALGRTFRRTSRRSS
ncbi:MAG: hypothetical protein DRJ42_10915 [Deltaproteobacteria bacterium]|nr:MAG: hypothetical protein DRJ42_10915 [Deltaproteobacteria bacterium]